VFSWGEWIRHALALDPAVYRAVLWDPQGLTLALAVVALAGLSEALAQSLVLFINQVRPRRFVLALWVSAITHVVGFFFWTGTIWLIARYGFGRTLPYLVLARAIGLAYAPQLLGFFVLTPYLGSLFALAIAVWSLLATVVAVSASLGMSLWEAAACSGLGWLGVQVWRRTLGRPVGRLERWLQQRTAGIEFRWTLRDVAEGVLVQRIRERLHRARSPGEPDAFRDEREAGHG